MTNNKQQTEHIVDANEMISSVEWFSNQAHELFEQYSEGRFDRITLNILMLQATGKAKEMEKEQIEQAKLDAKEIIIINYTEHGGGNK